MFGSDDDNDGDDDGSKVTGVFWDVFKNRRSTRTLLNFLGYAHYVYLLQDRHTDVLCRFFCFYFQGSKFKEESSVKSFHSRKRTRRTAGPSQFDYLSTCYWCVDYFLFFLFSFLFFRFVFSPCKLFEKWYFTSSSRCLDNCYLLCDDFWLKRDPNHFKLSHVFNFWNMKNRNMCCLKHMNRGNKSWHTYFTY